MGSIFKYQTKNGQKKYRILYRKPDGKQTSKRSFSTKREAQIFLASVEIEKATGNFIDPKNTKIQVLSLGEEWLFAKKVSVKPSTFRVIEITWEKYIKHQWGKRSISSINHSDIQNWISQLAGEKSPTVTIRAHGIISGILELAVKNRIISTNVAKDVQLPKKKKKKHVYLTHKDIKKLAESAKANELLIYVLAYTGIRWGEAVALKVKNVDLEKNGC